VETILSRLREWRSIQAREFNLPAYCIISNAHLEGVAASCPTSLDQLAQCKGMGPKRLARYGVALLEQVSWGLAEGLAPGVTPPEAVQTQAASKDLTEQEVAAIAEALWAELARQVTRRLKGRFTPGQVAEAVRRLSLPA